MKKPTAVLWALIVSAAVGVVACGEKQQFSTDVQRLNEDFSQVRFFIESESITVFDVSGKKPEMMQQLDFEPVTDLEFSKEMFSVEDLNFDGNMDICMPSNLGASNVYSHTWLWDETVKGFVYSRELSQLSLMQADPKNQIITTAESIGGGEHMEAAYDWVDGRFTLLWETRTLLEPGTDQETIIKIQRQPDGSYLTEEEKPLESVGSDIRADMPKAAEGSYIKEGSSEYKNGTLMVMHLGNDMYLFECFVMDGSEETQTAEEYELTGIFSVDADGSYRYEDGKDPGLQLSFVFDDQTVTIVEEKGGEDLPVHLAGLYDFGSASVGATEASAITLLEFLPPAVTGLNESNRPYLLRYDPETEGDYYEVQAIHTPTQTVIADFLIAYDMQAIYRVDGDMQELIFQHNILNK